MAGIATGFEMGRAPEAALSSLSAALSSAGMEEFAYEDSPLPISAGQTISQPYIVALMIEAAQIKPGDHVLDVGGCALMEHPGSNIITVT
jgi:protein-L-isoaspartate O-methyltransferase